MTPPATAHGFWHRHLVGPIMALLRQGMTPEKIALGMAFGITIGVAPMIGSTTILCALAALILRLNPAAIQIVNYLMSPLQLLLLIPLIRAGEWMFGAAQSHLTIEHIRQLIAISVWHAITTLWTATMHAMAVWILLSALLLYPIYRVILHSVRGLASLRGGAI